MAPWSPEQQDLGHRHPPELRRSRVLRMIQQPRLRERVALVGLLLPDDAGHEPRDGLDHHESGDLAARRARSPRSRPPRQAGPRRPARPPPRTGRRAARGVLSRKFSHERLVEASTCRRQQERAPAIGVERLDRSEERLGLHHHARPAAVAVVVDHPVASVGPVAKVVDADVEESFADRPSQEAFPQRCFEDAGEDREHIDPHLARLATLRRRRLRAGFRRPAAGPDGGNDDADRPGGARVRRDRDRGRCGASAEDPRRACDRSPGAGRPASGGSGASSPHGGTRLGADARATPYGPISTSGCPRPWRSPTCDRDCETGAR